MITYGICKNLSWLAILAKEKGMFREDNIYIDFRFFPTGRKAALALQKGWVDIANIIDANVAWLAFERKPNIKLIYSLQVKSDAGILARKDSGIVLPADLRGKRVAYLPKTSSHMFLVKFCSYHGLDMEEINLKVMTPETMTSALLKGEIDAFSIWEPGRIHTRMMAAQQNIHLTYFKNDCNYKFHIVLGSTEKAQKKKSAEIENVITVLRRASIFFQENKEEAQCILAQSYNLHSSVFSEMMDSVTLSVENISAEFKDHILAQMAWLHPDKERDYENLLTSFYS